MENTGSGSFLRNRRLESFLNPSSGPTVRKIPQFLVKGETGQRTKIDNVFVDDDGWVSTLISWVRIVICFLTMMVTTLIWALIMTVLLPWPFERIRQGNLYGHVTGRLLMWILGNPVKIEASLWIRHLKLYCNNRLAKGTVGIAKKEIIWYPLFGQLYVLANHLRIDRSNPTSAIESMKEAAQAVVKNNLSLIIFPEGTRSKDGRLLPFKKGFVHLALQSRLPIVPIILTGTHLAWRKGSLHVRPAPLTVKFLEPISTIDWKADKIDDYIKTIHDLYVKHLPESQRPLVSEGSKISSS